MTLVAAIRANGVPVLIGDLMLTGGDRVSTRRKIMRLKPNLVVGWSGALIAARVILRELRIALPRTAGVRGLKDVLKSSACDIGRLDVQLVGWLWDDEPIAFMWDSQYPDELPTGDKFLIGSGSDTLWRFLEHHSLDSPPPQGTSALKHASCQALTIVGNLMKTDLSNRILQEQLGFGIAYDALVGDSRRFSYLSPVVYAALRAEVDSSGHLGQLSRPWGIALLRNVGEHTICQIGRNIEGVMDIDLIDPPLCLTSEPSRQRLKRALLTGPFVFEGEYCVVFTQLMEGDRPWPPLVGVFDRASEVWKASNRRGVDLALRGPLERAAKVMSERRHGRW